MVTCVLLFVCIVVPAMAQQAAGMMDSQMHIRVSDLLDRVHLLPIRGTDGKLHWDYSNSDPEAKKHYFGGPKDDSVFHLDQSQVNLMSKLGVDVNRFVDGVNSNIQNKVAQIALPSWNPEITAKHTQPSEQVLLQPQPQQQKLQSVQSGDVNRSNLSKEQLVLGHWYHKMGFDYDVTDQEWAALPAEERAHYVLVATAEDEARFRNEPVIENLKLGESDVNARNTDQQTAALEKQTPSEQQVAPKQETPPEQQAADKSQEQPKLELIVPSQPAEDIFVNTKYRVDATSDKSGQKLMLGHWYHRQSPPSDITDKEFDELPNEEKPGFELISTTEQVALLIPSADSPTTKRAASTTPKITTGRFQNVTTVTTTKEVVVTTVTPYTEQVPKAAFLANTGKPQQTTTTKVVVSSGTTTQAPSPTEQAKMKTKQPVARNWSQTRLKELAPITMKSKAERGPTPFSKAPSPK